MTAPIIVTALLGPMDFRWADDLRRAHFPPERNVVPAHITLFHHLPPKILPELAERLKRHAAAPAPSASLAGLVDLGSGVAYRVESEGLAAIRDALADAFSGLLIPQDRARPRFHITVQNKARPERARALFAALSAGFRPRPIAIAGLAAWHYRGGPWELAMKAMFRG
ncbi:MAG: 2'-5' RNA ligase family protein [Sphingobium sp.]|nr:2'-5' RNA ligase family protein [Sphingobium sp.]